MGRKRKPKTTLTRIRIKDLERLRKLARQSKISIREYISRISRRRLKV